MLFGRHRIKCFMSPMQQFPYILPALLHFTLNQFSFTLPENFSEITARQNSVRKVFQVVLPFVKTCLVPKETFSQLIEEGKKTNSQVELITLGNQPRHLSLCAFALSLSHFYSCIFSSVTPTSTLVGSLSWDVPAESVSTCQLLQDEWSTSAREPRWTYYLRHQTITSTHTHACTRPHKEKHTDTERCLALNGLPRPDLLVTTMITPTGYR